MDDFEIRQVESDDPETFKYVVKLPEKYCNPEFLALFKQQIIKEYLAYMSKMILEGVGNGRD